ncbi:MAG TPA: HD domain-containing protein [Candidatus Sulfomarinibacteraceae bacterium]|nr:HD domain-containing protein [Candidatus Sulfomarinibacteraceae bacterium]
MSQDTDPDDDWRDAVREAMHEATLHEAQQRFDSREPVYNYRWEHVRAVRTLALKLARMMGADEEVVEAAAWLHDVRKVAGEEHPEEGAEFARRFLAQTNFPPHKIERVAQAIAAHKGLWREEPLQSVEAQVLWDADKLSKLGLTAAFHWTGMSFANGNPLSTEDLIAMARDTDWQERTVASMHTPAARRTAAERLASYNKLWDSLEAELEGRDLQ